MKEQIYYLIVVTDTKNKGQSPMYLLTSLEVDSMGMAGCFSSPTCNANMSNKPLGLINQNSLCNPSALVVGK